ncbi:MAG: transglutaminase family protein [Verrucomicrobia bacterium]|nr:transglutaminase family protein [Verrucomicrobiota bacterium]MBI3868904.1 transglutaminase family protein [Verrucomicrobiota bacterium]
MAIHVSLYHKTRYTYDKPVAHGPHVVRLRPAPHCRTPILSYSQKIKGGEHFINWQQDPFGNWNARLVFPGKMREFSVEVELVAEMSVYNPFDFFIEDTAGHFPFSYEPALRKDLAPFLEACPLVGNLKGYWAAMRAELLGEESSKAGEERLRTIDFLVALNRRLQGDIRYLIRLEAGVQSPEETLTKRSGSCRDSAWLLVHLLRHFGLAARFVSGYLIQLSPDQKALDGPSGTERDFTDLHAWCEVYLPGAGWIGLDPTSGLLAGEGHIPLSCTPEPSTAAAVSGVIDPCESELEHEMKIARIHESPRVTKPYTEEQWTAIDALGRAIDLDLQRHDVRLTMGGEPTFVSIDDPDGAEWNFTATSPRKRALSDALLKRLRKRWAPGSLAHYGQGKWYPGESLPRWAFACHWRKDGFPIWSNDDLIADEAASYSYGASDSDAFIRALSARLGLDARWILPGFEDPFYHAWQERRLPANVDPHQARLDDGEERARLAKILEQGLSSVVGHAVPVQRAWRAGAPVWTSGPWFLRAERLFLAPGDSPMGLRLPLDSLPWVSESEYPYVHEQDPLAPREALPSPEQLRQRYLRIDTPERRKAAELRRRNQSEEEAKRESLSEDPTRAPRSGESAAWVVRTALCVEARKGKLHVFMPPVSTLEDYLELIAAVEDTAKQLRAPVAIEGYPPPRDSRLNVLKVTPDPGVIEVNLHPSASWDELVDRTTTLYDEARQARLTAEKFMLDGRHTGTGGGNHILLGGATPGDSPLLRRPDLLRSLLAYWQNHPSLSWLFSGLFIGPTSQAPRVDEARHDALYELEVAFNELDRQTGSAARGGVSPWLVDRLFRNLLTDATGNTHRAEFSIDKLYPPDSAGGRLGLLEMRAFEMPPHARMSLAQHLLLRGLVSKFWKTPYANTLVRWGPDIHDRWMLPHFCEGDLRDVIHDLNEAGYAFEVDWFAPHFEFRFPRIGDFAQRNVQVELRAALEPWHVLGEEGMAGGAVRFVDSSLERLQVKARGLVGDRYALTVNGRSVPLHPTGVSGEAVAGVRYRAWQPPNCLQPTIGVHAPLVFDLYDRWNQRSLGGCTYHVAHPGGRSHSTFPVNSYEAESRRLARFFPHGALQGKFTPLPEPARRDLPFTLDLRHA